MNEYLKEYAENLSHSLRLIDSISRFTNNSAIIGQYAEKMVIEFIKKSIFPLKICTGAIIDSELFDDKIKIPQLDIIFYEPNPLPPLFHVEDFALVPKDSVFGVLEIKRTDYSSGINDLENRQDWSLLNLPTFRDKENGNLISSEFLGLICLVERHKLIGDNKLTRLINKGACCYLICKENNGYKINHAGVFDLINFIVKARNLNKKVSSERKISSFNTKRLF